MFYFFLRGNILCYFFFTIVDIIYLDKCEFANANTAFGISNGYFSIMLYPSPSTENVVYARGDFIPHVAISIPREDTAPIKNNESHTYILLFLLMRVSILWPKLPFPSLPSHLFVESFYGLKDIYDMIQ